MKRTSMKNPTLLALLAAAVIMIGAFQNCSNQMSFEAPSTDQKVRPLDDSNSDGGDNTDGSDPVTAIPDPDPGSDDDTDIDYDHEGRRMAFNCTTGANSKFDEAQLLSAPDLTLNHMRGLVFRYKKPVRYADVRDVRGAGISIENAYAVRRYEDVNSAISVVRALTIESVYDVQGAISTSSAVRLDAVEKIRAAYICASGRDIGTLRDLQGGFFKVRGRAADAGSPSAGNAKAKEISNVRAGFTSLYKIDVASISDIQGEVIIRDSTIDSIEGIRGGLTLINSTVRNLRDGRGHLRLLNSKIENKVDVQMNEILLPKK